MLILLSISFASAAQDDTQLTDDGEILTVSEDTLQTEETNEIINKSNEENKLSASAGTFDELRSELNGKTTFGFERDYIANEGDKAIELKDDIEIYGNGHTIDARGFTNIFKTDSTDGYKKIYIHNLIFKNGGTVDEGGSIYVKGNHVDLQIVNCTFLRNQAKYGGAAIYFISDNGLLNIERCNFLNNTIGYELGLCLGGAAIYVEGESKIIDSTFENNVGRAADGGAIKIDGDYDAEIIRCNFNNNKVLRDDYSHGRYGGAVCNNGKGTLKVTDSNFTNNEVNTIAYAKDRSYFYDLQGGAIYSSSTLELNGCYFEYNRAFDKGGAVCADGALRWGEKPNIFINNHVERWNIASANKGGAVYASTFANTAKEQIFINNYGYYGGAVYINNKNDITFESCYFEGNYALSESATQGCGAAIYVDSASSTVTMVDNIFYNNKATSDNAIFNCGKYGTVTHNWWGTNDPNFNNEKYIVEWHRFKSNEIKTDSNPLKITLSANQTDAFHSPVKLTLKFVCSDNTEFTGNLANWTVNFTSNNTGKFSDLQIDNTEATVIYTPESGDHLITAKVHGQEVGIKLNNLGDFTWLQKQINDTPEGGVLNLFCNLTYNQSLDHSLFEGVKITKPITINGNGYKIDGLNNVRVFSIQSNDVKINNITFANGNYRWDDGNGGGAISINNVENVSILNSIFTNNKADQYGGAIAINNGINIQIINSQFINNTAPSGGAINMSANNVSIDGCEFTNNTALKYRGHQSGGAIANSGENVSISNSIFLNNKADSDSIKYNVSRNNLTLTFIGMNNYINAIQSDREIKFSNVTYWDGNITTGDNPIHSSNESGVNLTVTIFDSNGNAVKKVNLETDKNGQAKFDFSTMEEGNYTFNAFHDEDNYYTKINTTGEFTLKRIVVVPSSVNIITDNKKEFKYGNVMIEFNIVNKTECNIVITNQNSSEVLYDSMTERNYFDMDLSPIDEYYNITVYNVGNETVAPSKDSILFKVLKVDSEINIESLPSEITYGTDAYLSFRGESDCHEYNVTIFDENNQSVFSDIVWVAQTYGSMQIPTLNVGNYTITVTNLGNNHKNQNNTSGKFTVTKANNHVEVLVADGVYGESTTVTVNADLDGEYLVSINELNLTVDVVNGTGSKSVELPAGSYNAFVSFNSLNVDSITTNDTFNISKAKSNVDARISENITYGTNNVIYLVDDFPTDYNVLIYDEGYNVVFNETFKSTNFTLPNLTVGTYNLTVINLGNENIEGYTDSQIFSITRDNNVVVFAENSDYGREVSIGIKADVDGFYTVDINGTEITIEVINGTGFYYDYLDLDAGDYYANASFDNPDYDNIIENDTFTINVAESNLEIMEIGNVTYGENAPIEYYDDYPTIFEVLIIDENGTIIMNSTTTLMYFELGDLEPGEYYVLVKNPGDDNVIGSEDYISFNVVEDSEELKDTPINIGVFTEGNKVIIVASVDVNATGDVEFDINGSSVIVPLENGIAVLPTFLPQGEYTVEATYSGDDYYNSNSSSESFNVTDSAKKDTEISPSVVVDDYYVTLTVAVSDNATGFVQMDINNKTYYAHIDDGKTIFDIKMDAGNYTADLTYLGDDSFNKAEASINFTVNDKELKDPNLTLGAKATDNLVNVLVSIDPEATGYVLLSINDYDVFFVLNGSGLINYNTLMAPGNYSINTIYLGDDDFHMDTDATDLTVSAPVKDNSTMDINLVNGTVVISVVDADNNPIENASVIVSVNGNETKMATDSKGLISVDVTGNATVTAVYTKADKSNITSSLKVFENNETAIKEVNNTVIEYVNNTIIEYVNTTVEVPVYINNTVEVPIIRNATQIVCKNMTTTAITNTADRNGEYFTFTLKDGNGKILANKPVAIGFNGKVYNKTTNTSGQARLQVNLKKAGGYTFAIAFLGDDEFNASFAVAKITVNKQKASLTVPNKSYKATAKTKSLTATFKDSKGKVVSGKKITFTVNGKTYSAKTNAKGVATVKVSLSTKKTYSFTAKYAGDNTFEAVTKKAKVVIK